MAIRIEEKVILTKSELRKLFDGVIELTHWYAKIYPDIDDWELGKVVYEKLEEIDKAFETLLNED